jgi:hypothetical protein
VSDDVGTDEESESRDMGAVRDDIMKRLLEYQRRQRGEPQPAPSVWATPPPRASDASTAAEPRVEEPPSAVPFGEAPAPETHEPETYAAETSAPETYAAETTSAPEMPARIEALHEALDRVASQIGDLRQTFQDMAIAADERLAELEAEVARVRHDSQELP